jgi:hypothetical protein
MQMVRHDHVSEEEKLSRLSRFIKRFAGDKLHDVSLEDWQPIFATIVIYNAWESLEIWNLGDIDFRGGARNN